MSGNLLMEAILDLGRSRVTCKIVRTKIVVRTISHVIAVRAPKKPNKAV